MKHLVLIPLVFSFASAEELVIPHVKITYSGMETGDARALAQVLTAARQVYLEDYGFDMPGTIELDAKTSSDQSVSLWNDGECKVFLRLKSREQLLDKPAETGVHNLYGLCHELGHIAMYRMLSPFDWMSNDAAEAWAHYAGSAVVDRVFEMKGETLWPEPYDYREDGMARLRRGIAAGRDIAAGKWLELERIVGRKGFRSVFAAWANATFDPMRPSDSLMSSQSNQLQEWWTSAAPALLRRIELSPTPPFAISPDALTGKPKVLALGNGSSEGKYSRTVYAHGLKFSNPEPGDWYIRAVSVYAERYGGDKPPDKRIVLALCDREMRLIATWIKPYAAFSKEMGWVRLELPPTKVPREFYLTFSFAPTDSDRIYVGIDKSTSGHSVQSRPGEPPKAFDKGDWMMRAEIDQPKFPR